jgi:hypothetical protein
MRNLAVIFRLSVPQRGARGGVSSRPSMCRSFRRFENSRNVEVPPTGAQCSPRRARSRVTSTAALRTRPRARQFSPPRSRLNANQTRASRLKLRASSIFLLDNPIGCPLVFTSERICGLPVTDTFCHFHISRILETCKTGHDVQVQARITISILVSILCLCSKYADSCVLLI